MANSDTNPDDDINQVVREEWVEETTPFERVREVVRTTYTPVSADTVADRAGTAPKTARKHLTSLASEGYVDTESGDHGATLYRRSPESLVLEQATDILDQVSVDELATRVDEMRDRIAALQAEFGVDSPEELVVDRANQTLSDVATERDDVDAETVQEWRTTRRNLAFANAALSIANAERFVDDTDADEGVATQ